MVETLLLLIGCISSSLFVIPPVDFVAMPPDNKNPVDDVEPPSADEDFPVGDDSSR